MKKLLTIVLAWASLVVMLSFVMAGSFKREPGYKAAAQYEDNLPAAPARNVAPPSRGIAHIIHVPQAGDRASVNSRGQSAIDDDDGEEFAPPPRRRAAPAVQRQDDSPLQPRPPRWQPRSEAPPPQESHQKPRRAMLNAAPPLAEGPTPIRPIPKLNSKADPVGKFEPPPSQPPNGG